MKFKIEEMDMEEAGMEEDEIEKDEIEEDDINAFGEVKKGNEKPSSFSDDIKSETEDSVYSEEGTTALLEADGLTPEEEGFMKGYLDE